MNKIPNRQAICEVLMKHAETDKDIVVLCSDSRGSASLTPFANAYPEQFVEMGIAEQDLVSVSAGLAKCGKKAFAASPACFLSTRSYEQAKIDCAYSNKMCIRDRRNAADSSPRFLGECLAEKAAEKSKI